MSEVAHQVLDACNLIMELKQQGFYRKLTEIEVSDSDKGLSKITEDKQTVRYMDRVLTSMNTKCLSTIERTTDSLEMFFNSFSHAGDETLLKRHKEGILEAQIAQAKTFRGIIKLTSEKEQEILAMSGVERDKFRGKKSLNESVYLTDVPGESPWSGLSKVIDENLVDWTAGGTFTWDDEPWPEDDPRWSFDWWLARKLNGLWPTFPLVPSVKYLPKNRGGSVNYSAWTEIRDGVTDALSAMNRKERRRAARLSKSGSKKRQKRQVIFLLIAALVSVGSVLFNEYEINSMVDDANSNLDASIEVMDQENHRLSIAEHSISMIQDSLKIVRNELRTFGYKIQADEAVFEAHVGASNFYGEIDRFLGGFETLAQGFLSPAFVKVKPTEKKLTDIRNKLKRKGYSLGISNFNEIYSLPCSHAVYEDGSAYAILHIPVFRDSNSFTLYSYDPLPYVDVGSTGSAFTIGAENDLIAVSRDESRHVLMKLSELEKCTSLGDTRICPNNNIVSRQNKVSCLGALFKGDLLTARKLCTYKPMNNVEYVTQTGTNTFLLYAKKQTVVKFVCSDGKEEVSKRTTISGAYLLTVQGGCVAYTSDHELEGQLEFSAQIKGYEIRPLNLTAMFSEDGSPFNEKDLELLEYLDVEIGQEVPVSTVAKLFHRYKTTSLWQKGVNFLDSISSYISLAAGVIGGLFALYLGAPLIKKMFTCCWNLAAKKKVQRRSSVAARSGKDEERQMVEFNAAASRKTYSRSSVWGRSRRKDGTTPTNLQIARDLAKISPDKSLAFLRDITSSDDSFSAAKLDELNRIVVGGEQLGAADIGDIVFKQRMGVDVVSSSE